MNYGAIAHINLDALQHNLHRVQEFAPHSKIMAMLKADAYGHGLVQAAKCLSSADAFGLAYPEEALELRAAGINKRLVLMHGFINDDELRLCAEYNLDVVIHSHDQLLILQQAKLNKKISAWLKIDTGMHRLGFDIKEVEEAYRQLTNNSQIQKPLYIMTHFAEADDLTKTATFQSSSRGLTAGSRFPACAGNDVGQLQSPTEKQLFCFAEATQNLRGEGILSMANSAGIIAWPKSHADWVRPGIMLYGVSPFTDKTGLEIGLKPVMTLKAKLLAVKNLSKGDKIGYGGTYECPENMPIGIAGIGYGDGYPWHAKNGTPVLVNGIKCYLAGRVSMDMITIDLRNNPKAQTGDTVTLWGDGLPVEHIARNADTIPYELFCRLTNRVRFVFV